MGQEGVTSGKTTPCHLANKHGKTTPCHLAIKHGKTTPCHLANKHAAYNRAGALHL